MPAGNRLQLTQHLRQLHLRLLKMNSPALNAAHIENVIDERHKMVPGNLNLRQIIPHLFLLIHAADGQCRETADGIHRCPDVMRNI